MTIRALRLAPAAPFFARAPRAGGGAAAGPRAIGTAGRGPREGAGYEAVGEGLRMTLRFVKR